VVSVVVKGTLCTVIGLAALGFTAPATAAPWHTQLLSKSSSGFEDVALSGNARGDAAVAFERGGGVALAFARRGHRFGKAKFIRGSSGASAPRVAIDAQGNALVLWNYFDGFEAEDPESRDEPCCTGTLMTVRSARNGHFRRVQPLTPPGHEVTAGAFAIASGRVGVAWSEGESVRARFAARGKRLGATAEVSAAGEALAVSLAHGGRRVTYARFGTGVSSLREFRSRNGRASKRRTLAAGLPGFAAVAVATNARGEQVAAWQGSEQGSTSPVYLAVRKRGGKFTRRLVSHHGTFGVPRIAIAPSGAAVAAWATTRGALLVSSRPPGGRFDIASRFDKNGRNTDVDELQLAINSVGLEIIGWTQQQGDHGLKVFGAFRTAFGARSTPHRLRGAQTLGNQGTAAIDSRGRARIVWSERGKVRVARTRYPG
jgi:hypothetical protein